MSPGDLGCSFVGIEGSCFRIWSLVFRVEVLSSPSNPTVSSKLWILHISVVKGIQMVKDRYWPRSLGK